jgi:methylenetetrahydrofolate dehydrogenase (NADP+)/methenyltetrahydrofolate cyclohydrolase
MTELRGKIISEKIRSEIIDKISSSSSASKYELAIIRIGENSDQITYQNSATKKLSECGINVKSYNFEENIENSKFVEEFKKINASDNVRGILLLKPLPKHIDEIEISKIIDEKKDLDGISPFNFHKAALGLDGNLPCTAMAVVEILKGYNIELSGKKVAIVNRSLVVGKSLAMLLLKEDATITICHSKTANIKEITSSSDIVVFAIGKPKTFDESYIKEGAVVIDVSINLDENGKLCGDCDYESMSKKAGAITPVPGGVGAVTTIILGKHYIQNI